MDQIERFTQLSSAAQTYIRHQLQVQIWM